MDIIFPGPSFVRRCITAGVIALSLPILAACGACRANSEDTGGAPLVRIGVGVGSSVRSSGVANLTELLYSEPLVTRQVDGRPAPHLAESWSWESPLRLRLRLKPNVSLHNGELLTPALVAESLTQQVDAAREGFREAFATVARITASGEDVVIDLAQPDALLLSELLGLRITDPAAPDNGTGPFRIIRREPQAETARFDGYHGGPSALGAVHIVPFDSQRSAWAALLRGDVEAVQEVSRDSVEFLDRSGAVETYSFLQSFYIPLVFNLQHDALRHAEVRRAIVQALDRQAIVQKAMRGLGQVADGPIWPLHWAFRPPDARYGFAPERAVERLERAGFPLRPPASADAPRSRFTIRCLFWSEDAQYERIALMIERQLFDIGIDVTLEPVTLQQLRTRVAEGDFDTFLIRTNASRALDITYRFWRSAGEAPMQRSGYTGADELLDALQRSTSDEEVRRVVAALSDRFHEDAPAAFIAWTEVTRAIDAGFVVPDVGAEDPFAKIWQWRPAGDRR